MDPLPPPLPSFSDVLDMIETIPNAENAERVTLWAKDKYSSEANLEAKVERLEKKLVNSEFNVKNLEKNVSSLRCQVFEQKKQLTDAETVEATLKAEIVTKDEKILELFDKCHEWEKMVEDKNQMIIEMLETIDSLQKQTAFYEEEITKLLDEKEKMLNEVVEEASDVSDDDDDDDDDDDEDSDSDDSSSSDSDSDDEMKHCECLKVHAQKDFCDAFELVNQLDSVKEQLKDVEALLLEAREKTAKAKKETAEGKAICDDLTEKMMEMDHEFMKELEEQKMEQKQILLKFSKETKKAQEAEVFQKAEIAALKKRNLEIQAANRLEMDMVKGAHLGVVTKLTDQIRELNYKCQYIVNNNAANVMKLQREFQSQLSDQTKEIQEMQESQKKNSEKCIVAQDKLVAQMEINMQLQKDVIELTRQIQALQTIDDAESAIGVEEQVAVGEEELNVEIGDEEVIDIDYSSDSSFEPIDEHEL